MKRFVLGAILAALTLIALSPLLRAQDAKKAPPKSTPAAKPTGEKAKADLKKVGKTDLKATDKKDLKATDKKTLKATDLKVKAAAKEIAGKVVKTAKGKAAGKYAVKNGTRLRNGGICYKGAVHRPWTLRFYSQAWRMWLLYDPNADDWYFWHPVLRTYYPLSLLRSLPPALQPVNVAPNTALKNTVPINVSNVQVANTNNGPKNVPNVPNNVTVVNPSE